MILECWKNLVLEILFLINIIYRNFKTVAKFYVSIGIF